MKFPRKTMIVLMLAGIASLVHAGTFVLPLDRTNGWQFLTYRKITPNAFHSTPAGLVIGVTNSAAPAVFPLTGELRVVGLKVSGSISGSLNMPPGAQGKKGFDDYALRVGLVESGSLRLNWRDRLLAADWVKRLFALEPPNSGIGGIHFFNVGTEAGQIGHERHYSGDVPMEQAVECVPNAEGHFSFNMHFMQPIKVIAVWISCDGDDTDSSFAITLKQVALETAAK
jgi:hypothetical protein